MAARGVPCVAAGDSGDPVRGHVGFGQLSAVRRLVHRFSLTEVNKSGRRIQTTTRNQIENHDVGELMQQFCEFYTQVVVEFEEEVKKIKEVGSGMPPAA